MPGGLHPPLDLFLEWPRPNYVNPLTKPKYVLVLSCILGPISLALLLVRLWVRLRIQKSPGWDDWLMLASFFPVAAMTFLFPWITEKVQFNRHMWDIELGAIHPLQRYYVMAIYILFTLSSGLIKMSVLLFYRRLSTRSVSRAFRWTLRITIGLIGMYTVIFIFITIFMCSPISAFWNQVNFVLIASGTYQFHCLDEGAEIVANGIMSTIQDFIAASLPAALCWRLQMHRRKKMALYCVFAVSYSVVLLGALRTHASYTLFFETYDVTWAACDVWLWSLLEIHIGGMCANAPTLRVFYVHYIKNSILSSSSSSSSSSLRSKLSFWKKSASSSSQHSHSTRGLYLLESHDSKHHHHHPHIISAHAAFAGADHHHQINHVQVEMGRIRAATRMSIVSNSNSVENSVEALPRPQFHHHQSKYLQNTIQSLVPAVLGADGITDAVVPGTMSTGGLPMLIIGAGTYENIAHARDKASAGQNSAAFIAFLMQLPLCRHTYTVHVSYKIGTKVKESSFFTKGTDKTEA
ncbi:hypothetical protein ACEQ8H_008354 [Pleosporales sp. CAS-2024a]